MMAAGVLGCASIVRGKTKLQRLFPAFPGGRPGVGLLLLRVAVGVSAMIQGEVYLADVGHPTIPSLAAGLLIAASGALVLAGFLTPIVSALLGVGILGTSLSA